MKTIDGFFDHFQLTDDVIEEMLFREKEMIAMKKTKKERTNFIGIEKTVIDSKEKKFNKKIENSCLKFCFIGIDIFLQTDNDHAFEQTNITTNSASFCSIGRSFQMFNGFPLFFGQIKSKLTYSITIVSCKLFTYSRMVLFSTD